MKKIMIAAAAAALVGGAFASCAPGLANCDAVVFTLKGSGKISAENSKETYKTNAKISPKGYLVITQGYTAEILASLKYKGDKAVVGLEGEVTQLGAYGKNLEKYELGSYKPGKTYKMESDLGVLIDDGDFQGYISTFGNVKFKVSKEKVNKSACGPAVTNAACEITWTPVKYSGWFAGEFEDCVDEVAPLFVCNEFALTGKGLFGGKVTLKYSKKLDSASKAEASFANKYLSKAEYIAGSVAEDLDWTEGYEDDEDEDEE